MMNYHGCEECPLALCRKRDVAPRGGFKRSVMFIGEAPGEEEERTGQAFVGQSGKMLDQWIEQLGLTEDDVYITNVVKCRPPKNRDPTEFEISGCLPHLAREIRELHPKLVIPLGRFARDVVRRMVTEGLLLEKDYGLSLKHPAWYLRQGGWPSEELKYLRLKLQKVR